MTNGDMRSRLRELYVANTPRARRFRYGLLMLDAINLAWIVTASFMHGKPVVIAIDVLLGLILAGEFAMRMKAWGKHWRIVLHPLQIADIIAILSLLLAPIAGEALAFLRVLRTLRLLHSVRLIASLRSDLPFFRRNEEATLAAAQLGVFLIIMSGVVLETQRDDNGEIHNYLDALYFTVTTLTTTGFGDITLTGPFGRVLTVVIMLAGVTLFLRLAQTLIRPKKIRFMCPSCGLQRHEPDAVHCKACGVVLNIPDDGS